MLIQTFPVGPLACNCSIVADEQTRRAVVIDPGGDPEVIEQAVRKHGLRVDAILHTHTHIDHVGATGPVQTATGAPARIHEADRFMIDLLGVQSAFIGLAVPPVGEIDGDLRDETVVPIGGHELAVMHTPGHSPGSVCFLLRLGEETVVFSGDTLFRLGIGRTDLWGGETDTLLRSIRARLYTLDDATRVIPGHGEETTIGVEKRGNPFVRLRG
jgi:glyoxylase-like metal-dependent hydrolase (beta-lactamase superfamily II)